MRLYIIAFILLISFSSRLVAQPYFEPSYEMLLKTAEKCAEDHDYYSAIDLFEKAFEKSTDLNLKVAIGDLYFKVRDFAKAQKAYERVLKKDKRKEYDDIRLAYAKVLKANGNYKEAMVQLNYIITTTKDEKEKEEATVLWKGIKLMDTFNQNVEAEIKPLGENVNSASAESSPVFYPDGTLFFSSFNRKKEIILDGDESDYHAKIYLSKRAGKGEFDKATALPTLINRDKFNNSGITFTEDGKTMYFTRVKLKNNGVESSVLYAADYNGGEWSAAKEVTQLKSNFKIQHPCLGELFGEKVLYFSSDMDGGLGGSDIYYSTLRNGNFLTPVNLGNTINTPFDEITPFYYDGNLYFSSNGHPGMGGHDVFQATWTGSTWSDMINIGFNYNSSYDDFGLHFNQGGTSALLVSNRPYDSKIKMNNNASCCDDIFMINIREKVIELIVLVNDEKGPLDDAVVELINIGGKDPLLVDKKSNNAGNKFGFSLDGDKSYLIQVTRDGYYPDTLTFNTRGIFDDQVITKTIVLKAKPRSEDYDTYSINEPIRLNNIYYDLDKANIRPEAEKDLLYLSELMEQYPEMVIELSSHTDSRSDDNYNQKLSQRRADSAKRWLVDQGVESRRIVTQGYGEKMLLNRCKNGIKCSEDEHRINRRTEFKIIAGPQTIEVKKSRLENTTQDKK
ncbi:MAG: OmpA family protein [Saprospiraceae bacterium]|nr:OmpA family protein [Saprospiraceae bacterium]MBK7525288.1 OmpA family protein [Saprospiraceae bacterium]MBK8370308.1 OmpA family protein [Saprospiraceae bacterium]MBK8854747.1 OmpA family protein [Saprospiraceae bacterium]MBK9044292.1 OmpA family protein [Saprospiraceae bacterium]